MICFRHWSTTSFSTIKAPRTVSRPSSEDKGRLFRVRKSHATVFPPKLTFFHGTSINFMKKKHGISWNFRINQENQLVIWRDLLIPRLPVAPIKNTLMAPKNTSSNQALAKPNVLHVFVLTSSFFRVGFWSNIKHESLLVGLSCHLGSNFLVYSVLPGEFIVFPEKIQLRQLPVPTARCLETLVTHTPPKT